MDTLTDITPTYIDNMDTLTDLIHTHMNNCKKMRINIDYGIC